MPRKARPAPPAAPTKIAIVVSRYNPSITSALLTGALKECADRGLEKPVVVEVPGSFELVVGCLAAARTGRFDGVVALGCLIRGQTRHDRVIAHAVAQGLVQVSLQTGVPVGFGVLTVNDARQARERAGGSKGNKGVEAMAAVLDTIQSLRAMAAGESARVRARADKARGKG